MKALKRIWASTSSSTVHNYWVHSSLLTSQSSTDQTAVCFVPSSEAFTVNHSIQMLLPAHWTLPVIALVNQTGGSECVKELCDEDTVSSSLPSEEP